VKEGGEPLIPAADIFNVTAASFAAIQSLQSGTWVDVATILEA